MICDSRPEHAWDLAPKEAIALQRRLADRVERRDRLGDIRLVAGTDVGFLDHGRMARGAVAVLSFPDLELLESAVAYRPVDFPYIPGLLSFREIPVLLTAFTALSRQPDLLICDGQGLAHPRRFGLACHLGVLLQLPTIGVGKTRLVGEHEDLAESRGSRVPLLHRGETVGAVLRSRDRVKPVYVSTGHRVSLATALDLVQRCTTRFRLPETTRAAHGLASG